MAFPSAGFMEDDNDSAQQPLPFSTPLPLPGQPFGGDDGIHHTSRITHEDNSELADLTEAEVSVTREVAAWLQPLDSDEWWVPRRRKPITVLLPSHSVSLIIDWGDNPNC